MLEQWGDREPGRRPDEHACQVALTFARLGGKGNGLGLIESSNEFVHVCKVLSVKIWEGFIKLF
jgi:hypothetical protein